MRFTVFTSCLLLALSLVLSAQEQPEEGGQPKAVAIPSDVREHLARLLPDSGVKLKPEGPSQFYSSNLFELIDGAAEGFHLFDLVAMVHQEYKGGGEEVTVDIFHMGNPLNAFGVYAAERSPEYKYIPVGAEGYISEGVLNFVQDRFYVKLSGFGENGKTPTQLQAVATAISAKIGASKALPPILALFPSAGLSPKSEKFIRKDPLGHGFLAPAVTAAYKFAGKDSSLLISQAGESREAGERVAKLREHFQKTGKVSPASEIVPGGYRGSNKFEGEILFFAQGPYAVLFINPPADPAPFLKLFLGSISK